MIPNTLWVLGASDPEMNEIETLLRGIGEEVAFALVEEKRVHPGNAYRVDASSVPFGERRNVIWVECGPHWKAGEGDSWVPATKLASAVVDMENDGWSFSSIDHHRPGDPGYGRKPENFLPASSLGQVLQRIARNRPDALEVLQAQFGPETGNLVQSIAPATWAGCAGVDADKDQRYRFPPGRGWFVLSPRGWLVVAGEGTDEEGPCLAGVYLPAQLVYTMAADHCLASAYQGQCKGVSPEMLMRWRVATRAAYQKRSVADVLADVENARKILRAAVTPPPSMGGCAECNYSAGGCAECNYAGMGPARTYADLRGQSIPELPEAAAREGIPFLSEVTDQDGRRKVVLQAAQPELVRQFLAGEVISGMVDTYGDAERGFAGGYLPTK